MSIPKVTEDGRYNFDGDKEGENTGGGVWVARCLLGQGGLLSTTSRSISLMAYGAMIFNFSKSNHFNPRNMSRAEHTLVAQYLRASSAWES